MAREITEAIHHTKIEFISHLVEKLYFEKYPKEEDRGKCTVYDVAEFLKDSTLVEDRRLFAYSEELKNPIFLAAVCYNLKNKQPEVVLQQAQASPVYSKDSVRTP